MSAVPDLNKQDVHFNSLQIRRKGDDEMTKDLEKEVIEKIIPVIRECGQMMLKAKEEDIGSKTEEKGSRHNLVTKYDKLIQEKLKKSLSEIMPDASFLGEENGERIDRIAVGVRIRQVHRYALSAGDGHLGERDGESAVAAVMVGERKLLRNDLLHRVEERLHGLRVRIRRLLAKLVVHLRETAAAEAVLGMSKIYIDEA